MKILQSLRTNTSRKAAESVETTTSGSAAKKKSVHLLVYTTMATSKIMFATTKFHAKI
jgi:hypothetical protein